MAALVVLIAAVSAAGEHKILTHHRPVKDSYIVILRPLAADQVDATVKEVAQQYHVTLSRRPNDNAESIFRYAFQGFSGNMKAEDASQLASDYRVQVVEQDAYLATSTTDRFSADDPHYNLDRLDQEGSSAEGDRSYSYTTTGNGVYIYIFDNGVNRNHKEFDNDDDQNTPNPDPRVKDGVTFASDGYFPAWLPCGGWLSESQLYDGSHGTAVASVAAGKTVGVAKDAYIVPVRIMGCGGVSTLQHWCWGMDWVAGPNNPYPKRPAVLNSSVWVDDTLAPTGTDPTPVSSFQATVNNVIAAGITVVVSANNQSNSDCLTSPALMGYGNSTYFASPHHVITVGGIDEHDYLWRCSGDECLDGDTTIGSNTGRCVDIYAPAHNLKLAWNRGYSYYREAATQKSGTSFAAPLVAGVAARILQSNPNLSPEQVWAEIQGRAILLPQNFDGDSVPQNDRVVHMDAYE